MAASLVVRMVAACKEVTTGAPAVALLEAYEVAAAQAASKGAVDLEMAARGAVGAFPACQLGR